jgi:hypothetical protein
MVNAVRMSIGVILGLLMMCSTLSTLKAWLLSNLNRNQNS